MHEEAHLTLKEKKKKKKKKDEEGGWEGGRVGGPFLRPRVLDVCFDSEETETITNKEERYIKHKLRLIIAPILKSTSKKYNKVQS